MNIVSNAWVSTEEVETRIGLLRLHYAGNPLVKRIDYRIGGDHDDDPSVFIEVVLTSDDPVVEQVVQLAREMQIDLLRLVRTEEIGLHSYLSFKRPSRARS